MPSDAIDAALSSMRHFDVCERHGRLVLRRTKRSGWVVLGGLVAALVALCLCISAFLGESRVGDPRAAVVFFICLGAVLVIVRRPGVNALRALVTQEAWILDRSVDTLRHNTTSVSPLSDLEKVVIRIAYPTDPITSYTLVLVRKNGHGIVIDTWDTWRPAKTRPEYEDLAERMCRYVGITRPEWEDRT